MAKLIEHSINKPLWIAGPCSAESKEQVLSIARDLKNNTNIEWFRAGIWKPRTRPNDFEGVAFEGLQWLAEVKKDTSLKVITEVATAKHVQECLSKGIDGVWIGARTTANPFYVQELAEVLRGTNIPVFIKNPLNPDIKLWIGAFERFMQCNNNNLIAVHRGFSFADNGIYRQTPYWKIPIELKCLFADIPILCDPSHIAGKRELIKDISQTAFNLGFDGLMIEVHNNPAKALTDKKQQITPIEFKSLIKDIIIPNTEDASTLSITSLREDIDHLDIELINILSQRMELSNKVGKIKKSNNISIFQLKRWEQMLKIRITLAKKTGISEEFIKEIFETIHQESIRVQNNEINKK